PPRSAAIHRRLVRWLVEPDLAAAGQHDCRLQSEFRVLDVSAAHLPCLQSLDSRMQVVAHQVQDDSEEVAARVALQKVSGASMGGHLGGRQREEHPTFFGRDGTGAKDSPQHLLVRIWSLAVQEKVSAVNHAMNLQGSVVGLNGLATLSYRHLKARLQPNIES